MRRGFSVAIILGVLLVWSAVAFADPITLPGTETIKVKSFGH